MWVTPETWFEVIGLVEQALPVVVRRRGGQPRRLDDERRPARLRRPRDQRLALGRPCEVPTSFLSGQHHFSARALITVKLRLVATPRCFSTAALVSLAS